MARLEDKARFTQDEFLHTFNALHEIVLTVDRKPHEIWTRRDSTCSHRSAK